MPMTNILSRSLTSSLNQVASKTTLLVDPNSGRLETRRLLLSALNYSVRIASCPREVFQLETEGELQTAILSDALGSFQMQAVAEYIRHRWPRTKILVIGRAVPALEDHLYDETVEASAGPAQFLAIIERCSRDHS